jgi:branched-chain amino acid aminotransferase
MSSLSNERIAYFNGKYVPESEVRVPFRDRSWVFGDGAFDMTRTFNGRVFKIEEHIERLYRSLKYLRIDSGLSPAQMIEISEEVSARNRHERRATTGITTAQP